MPEQRWGDLPIIPETESGIAAIEREQITKPRPVEISGATLYQPCKIEAITTPLTQDECSIDPLTLHTIQLIQHSRNLRSLIQIRQAETEAGANQLAGPSIPILPECSLKNKNTGREIDQTSDFVLGKGNTPPIISYHSVRQLLTKSVAAMCAHAGFDATSETVLDTLSDIAHEHFSKICALLRTAIDREAITGSSAFVDVMEQVFHEIGIGSITTLHEFYQSRIINYHQHMLCTCQQLEMEYEKIKVPQKKALIDLKSIKLKEEPVTDIQFPINEEPEAVGETPQTPPPLEELHGALQTMEKAGSTSLKDEEAMKWLPGQAIKKEEASQNSTPNLDQEEEIINVSDSPEPALTDVEISQSIPSVSDTMSPSTATENSQSCKPPKKKKKKL